jgi:hypothetical protein
LAYYQFRNFRAHGNASAGGASALDLHASARLIVNFRTKQLAGALMTDCDGRYRLSCFLVAVACSFAGLTTPSWHRHSMPNATPTRTDLGGIRLIIGWT